MATFDKMCPRCGKYTLRQSAAGIRCSKCKASWEPGIEPWKDDIRRKVEALDKVADAIRESISTQFHEGGGAIIVNDLVLSSSDSDPDRVEIRLPAFHSDRADIPEILGHLLALSKLIKGDQ